jgi:hypothetical protein
MTEPTPSPENTAPAERRRPARASGRRDLREIREALLLLHQQLDAYQADTSREQDDWEEERIRLRQERDELRMQVEALRRQVEGQIPPTQVELPASEATPLPQPPSEPAPPPAEREPAAAVAEAPLAPAAPPMTTALLVGWTSLFAGTTVHLLTPHVRFGVLFPLALALILGVATLFRRRTALVYGLIALTIVTPAVIGWAEANLDFQGLLAPRESRAAAPSETISVSAADSGAGSSAVPISVGESAVVDQIRIRFNQVMVGPVEIRDVLGQTRVSVGPYLQIDLTLANEGSTSVFAKKPWEKTRLVDDQDNGAYVVDEQRSSLDQILGAVDSAELEAGAPVSDRMVFPLPPEEAASFKVIADPGFYVAGDNGLLRQVSHTPIYLSFSRADIVRP